MLKCIGVVVLNAVARTDRVGRRGHAAAAALTAVALMELDIIE